MIYILIKKAVLYTKYLHVSTEIAVYTLDTSMALPDASFFLH